ncbi:nucleotidyl transferase AbiEii/AbiGii toxin family protein [Paenibacillus sp. 2TAB19]|uniref:nucleotidyl transferase AbiEii/AbiGii toxin family protein n=1 Tax=Paenibacillus sp. 2TAB19 TaxID=3233003 RepID=UPI003F9E02D6
MTTVSLDLDQLRKIRALTIIALFSDDDLLDTLVLKGGNALELGYGIVSRASTDLDFSMRQDFKDIGLNNPDEIIAKLDKLLSDTFKDENFPYCIHDVRFKEKPKQLIDSQRLTFWGGYEVNFKLISPDFLEKYKDNPGALMSKSIPIDGEGKKITIDFGKHEYVGDVTTTELDDYTIPIYTPTLIVLEKIRAICQQMEDYNVSIGKEHNFGKPRPRDFYDIYNVMTHSGVQVNLQDPDTIHHLKECFKAKRVRLSLISQISTTREFHKQEESKLRDSIVDQHSFKGFDYYFDYVVDLLQTKGLAALVA